MGTAYLGSRGYLGGVKRVDEVKREVERIAYPIAGIFQLQGGSWRTVK
jgi:hypothetical protein